MTNTGYNSIQELFVQFSWVSMSTTHLFSINAKSQILALNLHVCS